MPVMSESQLRLSGAFPPLTQFRPPHIRRRTGWQMPHADVGVGTVAALLVGATIGAMIALSYRTIVDRMRADRMAARLKWLERRHGGGEFVMPPRPLDDPGPGRSEFETED
jgi:hypothetical protein